MPTDHRRRTASGATAELVHPRINVHRVASAAPAPAAARSPGTDYATVDRRDEHAAGLLAAELLGRAGLSGRVRVEAAGGRVDVGRASARWLAAGRPPRATDTARDFGNAYCCRWLGWIYAACLHAEGVSGRQVRSPRRMYDSCVSGEALRERSASGGRPGDHGARHVRRQCPAPTVRRWRRPPPRPEPSRVTGPGLLAHCPAFTQEGPAVNPTAVRVSTAVLLAAATVLAGCTDDDPGTPSVPSSSPSTAASPSVDVEAGEARTQILSAYAGYQQAVMAASLKGDHQAKELAQYTAEPLLGQTRNSIYQIKQAGLVNKGERRWSPQITDMQLDQPTPTATIEDCTDTSTWLVVSRTTGKPAPTPSGRPDKYLVTSTAKKVGGKWYVAESKGDWNRPC
jgi:hypothetical protein